MNKITLHGKYLIKAPKQKVYEIITDFERSVDLFPDVAKSIKILERSGNTLRIEAQTRPNRFSKLYTVFMETELDPPDGFHSINTSAVGVEDETVRLVETDDGTVFDYENTMEITNKFYRLIAYFFSSVSLL